MLGKPYSFVDALTEHCPVMWRLLCFTVPNFLGSRHGVITRIATYPLTSASSREDSSLYGTMMRGVHVDAMSLQFDYNCWEVPCF